MAVLKDDFRSWTSKQSSFNTSKLGVLRATSSQPRRLEDLHEHFDNSVCMVNIEKTNDNNFPSFKVGPCQLQRKPRETKSAHISLSIRNLALSIRAARFNRKWERTVENPPDIQENSYAIPKENDRSSDNSKSESKLKLKNFPSKDEPRNKLDPTFYDDNDDDGEIALGSQPSGKTKKKKRSKTAKKMKIKRKNSLKEIKKKHTPRLGKLKISNDEKEQKSIIETLSPTNMAKVRAAYTKTSPLPKNNKSLPNVDPRSTCSSSKSQNSICEPEEITMLNRKSFTRCAKVYLSEKHSGTVMGVPAVPPGTPGLELQNEIEWVPSLSDIKSQRSIAMKLSNIVSKQRKKEKQERLAKEQKMQEDEKRKLREMQAKIKQRHRSEIYALNKILTEVENEQFERLKKEQGGLPV